MSGIESLEGKSVLVTGGAGFVGSNIVRRLIALRALPVVLDDFSTGSEASLPSEPSLEIVRASVTDSDIVTRLVNMVDYIVHAAARNIIISTRDPREDFVVNIGGTLNLLLALKTAGGNKRLV